MKPAIAVSDSFEPVPIALEEESPDTPSPLRQVAGPLLARASADFFDSVRQSRSIASYQ
jgi:hypothetical protein